MAAVLCLGPLLAGNNTARPKKLQCLRCGGLRKMSEGEDKNLSQKGERMTMRANHRARIKWKHVPSGRTGVYEDKPGEGTLYLSGITENFDDFLWTEGNFACDCNRRMLFIDEDRDGCSDDEFAVEIEDIGP